MVFNIYIVVKTIMINYLQNVNCALILIIRKKTIIVLKS